jgi:hypothetical protein
MLMVPARRMKAAAPARRRNATAAPADEKAAHELFLFATNDGDLYRRQIQPIIKNLAKKYYNGAFNKTRAVDAFVYAAESAAKDYTKQYGSGRGYGIFNPATRRAAAAAMLNAYQYEIVGEAVSIARHAVAELETEGTKARKNNRNGVQRNGAGRGVRRGGVRRNNTNSELLKPFEEALEAGGVAEGVNAAWAAAKGGATPPKFTFGDPTVKTVEGKLKNVVFAVKQGNKTLGTGYFKPKHGSVWVTWA